MSKTKKAIKELSRIKIYLSNGEKDEWGKKSWTDYKVAGSLFVVINDGAWVGVYPLNSIYKVVVK